MPPTDDEPPREYRQARFRRPPGACEILFVRHGESAPAVAGVPFPTVDGQSDPPLHTTGEDQAERVAQRLAASGEPISAIYVTTLQRTRQTAAPLAARLGLEPVVEADLREVFLGEWEGGEMFRKNMAEGHPVALQVMTEQRWDVIPGAEPADAFATRVRTAVSRIAGTHPDATVVAVVHGGVIGEVVRQAVQSPMGFAFTAADNGSITHIVVAGERWIVRRYNDTAHLGLGFTVFPEPLT